MKVNFSGQEGETTEEQVIQATTQSKPAELTPGPKDKIEPIKTVDHHVTLADSDYQKIVCGLPCDSPRREKELNYTLAVLTGVRNSKQEDKKPKLGVKRGFGKRKIL